MIPAIAHFIWFGTDMPWTHVLAMRSAAQRGDFERVVLHHADDLSQSRWWPELQAIHRFEARRLDPAALFTRTGEMGPALTALFAQLTQPAARANMVRAALLYTEGGVYLDTDTITMASLAPLRRAHDVFFGAEHVVLPVEVARSLNPLARLKALALDGLRDYYRRAKNGWRSFRQIEHRYHVAANNAVLASVPRHAFVHELLQRMTTMPPRRQMVRYALGTHLLQQVAKDLNGPRVCQLPPPYFYPLGPEISQHWFKPGTATHASEMCLPETVVIHWYASVRTRDVVPTLNPETVRAGASDNAFCALAAPFLD